LLSEPDVVNENKNDVNVLNLKGNNIVFDDDIEKKDNSDDDMNMDDDG